MLIFSTHLTFAQLSVTLDVTPIVCNGDDNGAITANAIGGTTPYTYLWGNGAATATIENLAPGGYGVTVSDAAGSMASATATLEEPNQLLSIVTVLSNVTCNNGFDGAASVVGSGGVGFFTYSWSNGQVGTNATNLEAGVYMVTTTDENGCTTENSVTITEPPAITLKETIQNVTCNGLNDGSIGVVPDGGESPYTYLWNNGATTNQINDLSPGDYSVVVTDAKGCMVENSYTIIGPNGLDAITTITNPLLCNGDSDAIVSVIASGGQSPYTYEWPDGTLGRVISNLAAGSYTVTITDANGCSITKTQGVGQPDAIVISVEDKKDASCGVANDGSITVSASGGTPGYQYLWSTGETTPTISNLAAGTYTITVTDSNGCTQSLDVSIDATGGNLEAIAVSVKDVSCPGGFDGAASIIASGGQPPFTYVWSSGHVGTAATNLIAGTYTATATDANGCSIIKVVTVVEPDPYTVTFEKTDVSCTGANDGIAKVTVTGANPPYNFNWSNGESGVDAISNLSPGTYILTVTDTKDCTTTKNVTITEPDPVTVTIQLLDDPDDPNNPNDPCDGAIGQATANPSGGTPPYSYNWSNGETTQTVSGLTPGQYDVTVTDANMCTATASVTVSDFPALMISVNPSDNVCPGANDGSVSVTAVGGSTPYTYMWNNGATTAMIDNLAAGSYDVTVSDANGCSQTGSTTIVEPAPISITFEVDASACEGSASGSAKANATGGSSTFVKYEWSDGQSTQTATNLASGTYSVVVTDSEGCTGTASVNISVGTSPTVLIEKTDVSCNGANDGTAKAIVKDGKEPYTYSWSNGGTEESINGLSAGTYSLTVTDSNGCTATNSVTINEHPAISISFEVGEVGCNDGATTTAKANATGGSGTFVKYEWSDGQSTQTATNLVSGTYTVVVTDSEGCTGTASVNISIGTSPSVLIEKTDVSCNGANDGTAKAIVKDGQEPYTYSWSNGGTEESINGLSAGTYSLTVTDSNGCTATNSVTINEHPAISISFEVGEVGCNDGATTTAKANATGGSGAFVKYEWIDGQSTQTATGLTTGSYTVIVTDSEGCTGAGTVTINVSQPPVITLNKQDILCFGDNNGAVTVLVKNGTTPYSYQWSNGSTNSELINLGPGDYSIIVTDAKGCTAFAETTIIEPSMFKIDFAKADPVCNGEASGRALAQGWGGTPPFTYMWSNGSTDEEITGLLPGTYSATVTDANGCVATGEVTINEKPAITVSISVEDVGCQPNATTSATATATGGNGAYATYVWSDGQTTQTATGLTSGDYSVTVTDVNGCTGVGNVTVNISQPPSVTIDKIDILCFEDNNGKATAVISGGVAPLIYQWSNGSTNNMITNLGPGDYSVTVTDAKGCSDTAETTIVEPFMFKIDFAKADPICNGEASGSALAQGWGGTAPYTYLWSTGSTNEEITGLVPGTYSATVTDANGCVATGEVTINEKPAVKVEVSVGEIGCGPNATTTATATATGGNGSYALYQWSDGQNTPTAIGLTSGDYEVTVTDVNGCTGVGSVTIDIPDPLKITTITKVDANCYHGSDGSATATVTGGVAPIIYAWSNGGSSATITGLAPGTYTLTVTDAKGCTDVASVTIIEAQTRPGIKGYAWGDADRNGLQGQYESGVNGVMVNLLTAGSDGVFCTSDDVIYDNQTTGNDGLYHFKCLPPGNYLVHFAMYPEGYQFTDQNVGNGTNDSDANPSDGKTHPVTIKEGGSDICDIDAGLYKTCIPLENAGTIKADQEICRGGTPATLTGTVPSTFGEMEYVWMYNNVNEPFNADTWTPIPGSNSQNYSPGELFTTTYFIRCVRRKGCETYIESNIIRVGVVDCRSAFVTFDAILKEARHVELNWKATPEREQAFYQIESSRIGDSFITVDIVEGKGNPSEIIDYQYTIEDANSGANYYRVRRIEHGMQEAFSNIAKVDIAFAKSLLVYPNPFYQEAVLESEITFDENSWVKIINSRGELVRQDRLPSGENKFIVNLSNQPSGMYYIQLVGKDGNIRIHKIQKIQD